jgi:tRNA threonylcarbamoyladenosine biosynthesis protein TsaB
LLILAIETSSPQGSVAVGRDGAVLAQRVHKGGDAHAEALFPLLDELLNEAAVTRHELQAVAVGTGPGSFTGLRVGIAFAEGIATGLGVPLIGVQSLANLAWSCAHPVTAEVVGALLDARRNELFFAAFGRDQQLRVEPELIAIEGAREHIEQRLSGCAFALTGSAAGAGLPAEWFLRGAEYPTAEGLLKLCEGPLGQTPASPMYLRAPELKLPKLVPNPLHTVP